MTSLFPPLPVFLDLIGRSVALCAGDRRAASFAKEALEAGAGVVAFHPHPCGELQALAPRVRLVNRRWRAADFRLASVVAVGGDERRPAQARASAKAAKAIFIMLDGSDQSDLALGEVAARGPVTVGVSASGLPVALAEAVRDRIEAATPPHLTGFFEAAARAGDCVAARLDPSARRKFWRSALAAAAKAGDPDWDVWLERRLHGERAAQE